MKQLRFKWAVATSAWYVLTRMPRLHRVLREPERYTEEQRYAMAREIMDHMRRRCATTTVATGQELLPASGGYMLCANHQGKYDALGILLSHDAPCAVLWERRAADRLLAREVNGLLGGQTIDLDNPRSASRTIDTVTAELAAGRRYLIFPEGGYADNRNRLQEFHTGCFRCAERSGVPLVPVAIWDSWRSMDQNRPGRVTTRVCFLPPIPPEEYAGRRRPAIAALVKERIAAQMARWEAAYGPAQDG